MFNSLCLLLCTVAFTQAYSNSKPVSPVPVTIYYESLCPYSVRFIVDRLVPIYNDKEFNFAGLLANMDLVPYGHVYNPDFSNYKYTCQHGVPECEGNKLHGCAVKYIKDKSILLNYISCLMNTTQYTMSPILSYPANECKNLVPSSRMQHIFNCYNSNEGWDLFNQHGMTTEKFFGPNRFLVPYVSFHEKKNDELSATAKGNFKKALCVQNGVRHHACSDYKV
ncbi:GILT-like protein 1 [Halyomorpha halys]|uniref:GILT-like protein 1 n=1 Tax=Halyomorpha halys TaxID=286706 RepID=UPI0006D4DA9F|nr:GILT-like protein 1 [Halyomorpha halys]